MSMSTLPDPTEQPAPRWLLALVGLGAAVMLVGASLAWLYRGSAIVLDMANFFCL
jgi:hypothetical protein